ncbi:MULTISPECIES: Xaa-Pro peptidase family protein [unclassified Enterococcus]|uniref:M24 family metallopeptidase n=1 Tax=unclassified Enterococcus TaxID=2608891 RepID=UPI001556E020|nr:MULTISPECIES: Xaa-Pro peptidase family protein [unclassified Enterococcus]MBS7575981.1 aminopeptidase P family protein [Enterococcus sp. MMGLQ5-2]MBS7583214.1 aminopeptidase P family protein [Enterococcus sp. MMGLQ5-1]NPD11074.1 aminopeptidase P family protein [Enterococcus sp. MMGLQ5-1]NPD35817.1 aminopeptidase P family protein [Enterococcus sp. MMGLQ5-2]
MQTLIEKMRQKMKNSGLDAILIQNLKNVFYLTGFTGTNGTVLLTPDDNIFITDSRYTEQATKQIKGYTISENRNIYEVIEMFLGTAIEFTIGFEDTISYRDYLRLEELPLNLTPLEQSNFVEELREIKTPGEIEIIRQACAISDHAFSKLLDFIQIGKTELELANFLDFEMRKLGASGLSFDTIVASGVRSAMPHGVASQKKIETGDVITFDFGCYYENYVSDMTRTIVINQASDEVKAVYQTVLSANQAVLKQAKAGISYGNYDRFARSIIEEAGYGDYFTHSIGHGIGIDIHEEPFFANRELKLIENQVITDEPGIYLPNQFGVRIEDDLVVTQTGVSILTHAPKELIVLKK